MPELDVISLRADDGTELAVGAHPADGDGPVAVLLHGIASHMGWYHGVGRALSHRGISAYVADRRGSGISGGPRGHAPDWETLIEDVRMVCEHVKSLHPGRPLRLMGISLGGVFATATALRHQGLVDGLILSAPAFSSTIKVSLAQRLRVLRRSFTEPEKLYDLPFGPADITVNQDWLSVILGDPLRTSRVTARMLTSIFKCQTWCKKQITRLDIPLYCMLAGEDSVIDNPGVIKVLERTGCRPRWIETFAGATHIIPASVPREELLRRLVPWINGKPHAEGPDQRLLLTQHTKGEVAAPPDLSETPA